VRIENSSAEDILCRLYDYHSELPEVLTRVRERVVQSKREISEYQAAALYALARPFDGGCVLEIGTAFGYSASVLAEACPQAQIVTLNPKEKEYPHAVKALSAYPNVTPLMVRSWDYLAQYDGKPLSLVWVDGDHERVRRDFPWWNHLHVGGLMLYHDYSPADSWRPTVCVYDALNELREQMGRDFDVLITDDGGVGMCGWYRREGETYGE